MENKTKQVECLSNPNVQAGVLQMICKQKIKVRPKWHFFVAEIFFWVLCVSLVIIASLVFSIVLYSIFDSDDGVLTQAGFVFGYLEYFLSSFFWLSIFLAISILAYIDFMKTRHGYKQFLKVTYTVIAIYLLFGSIFYFTHSFEFIEKFFINDVPYYHKVFNTKMSIWSRPEEGFLSGNVSEIATADACVTDGVRTTEIALIDFHDEKWNIDTSNTLWHVDKCLKKDDQIRIVGKDLGNGSYKAVEIWQW